MNVFWFCCFIRQLRKSTERRPDIEVTPPIRYSCYEKDKLNPQDFIIENKEHGVFGRSVGEIDGQQFVIRDCKNTIIYILDHINTVTIDDCYNCSIVTGPIKTSIFIRDCSHCHIMTACQQFRTRDCHDMTVFLACSTEPVIESSSNMVFGPYQCMYDGLENNFKSAGLSIFNCNWSDVYDFTPEENSGSKTRLLPLDDDARNYFSTPEEALKDKLESDEAVHKTGEYTIGLVNDIRNVHLSFKPEDLVVPLTLGTRSTPSLAVAENASGITSTRSALIAILEHLGAVECAKSIVSELRKYQSCYLVRTRYSTFSEYDMERIFGIPARSKQAKVGKVITLELTGLADQLGPTCEELVLSTAALHDSSFLRVTTDPMEANRQIDLLNGLYQMHMNTS